AKPDVRKRNAEVLAELAASPEVKAKKSAASVASWAGPGGDRRRAALASEATRAKMAESARQRWIDPEKAAAARAMNADPDKRRRLSERAKQRSTREYRAMMAEKTRLSWEKRRQGVRACPQ